MSRAPHPTLAHLVRDAQCAGKCRQGRHSSTACLHKSTCGSYMTTLHRVTPVQPEPEENGLLAFLDGWLCATQPWLLGGIAVCLVAMAIIAAHVIAWLIELTELAARMGAQ